MPHRNIRRRKRGVPLICLVITIAILIAGLWPFNFRSRNEVTWLDGQNGIYFGRRGITYNTEHVYGPLRAIRPGGAISVELVVRPARDFDDRLARILTLYDGGTRQFFALAQWKSHLVVRATAQGNDLHRDFAELVVTNVFTINVPTFLGVTSENGNTAIYADGREMKARRDFPILPIDPSVSGKFVLGNSPTGKSPWKGELLFLAAYDRELSAGEVLKHFQDWTADGTPAWLPGNAPALLYRFDERTGTISRNHIGSRYDLSIPATFRVLQKNLLRPPRQEEYFHRSFIRDVVINVLGFLPFGFFFAVWLRNGDGLPSKSHVFLIAMLGGGTSLIIELLQFYLPSRTSQLTDVIFNIIGTILGVYLLRWILLFLGIEKGPVRNRVVGREL